MSTPLSAPSATHYPFHRYLEGQHPIAAHLHPSLPQAPIFEVGRTAIAIPSLAPSTAAITQPRRPTSPSPIVTSGIAFPAQCSSSSPESVATPLVQVGTYGAKRRRGRQATACTECNRRKQKCDGSQPCSNCRKRNVAARCHFPETKSKTSPESSAPPYRAKKAKTSTSPSARPHWATESDDEVEVDIDNDEANEQGAADQSRSGTTGPTPSVVSRPRSAVTPKPMAERSYTSARIGHPVSSERMRIDDDPDNEDSTHRMRHVDLDARSSEDDPLMEEGRDGEGARGIGSLAREGAPNSVLGEMEYGGQFYGTSHFGPRIAAQVMHGAGNPTLADDVAEHVPRPKSLCADLKDSTLAHQIRHLVAQLPRREDCSRFVDAFFDKYNEQTDIIYEPDFRRKYDAFWNHSISLEEIVTIDLRWVAVLLAILAYGVLLDRSPDESREQLQDREEMSLKCFRNARRALAEAPSFYGDSFDTVRAGALFERLKRKELYILDRSISLFLGRTLSIVDGQYTTRLPANIHDSELVDRPSPERPLTEPTKTTFLIFHFELARVIGCIQTKCFGLTRRKHADVMECEKLMNTWRESLPPFFRLMDADLSYDEAMPWLKYQRHTLVSKFHQARISLHRPYLLRPLGRITADEYHGTSAFACMSSAACELRLRISLYATDKDPFDRFKWMTVASGFSPATILGILLARSRRDPFVDYDDVKHLLKAYIAIEKTTSRRDPSLEAELHVLDMMVAQSDKVDRYEQVRTARCAANAQPLPLPAQAPPSLQPPSTSTSSRAQPSVAYAQYVAPSALNLAPGDGQPRTSPAPRPYTMPPTPLSAQSNGPAALFGMSGDNHSAAMHTQVPPSVPLRSSWSGPLPLGSMGEPPLHGMSQSMLASSTQFQPNGLNMTLTPADAMLFPAQNYTDQGEEWMHPPQDGGMGSSIWAPRPPTDPSADAFPAADNVTGWQNLLSLLEYKPDVLGWYGEDGHEQGGV
ncbi:hypothetical protein Q5752_001022 [Cryptotrichosporon argae]